MITVEQMRNVAQDLISSYDARVDAVGTIIDNTYQILEDFKDKRAKLSAELKETLAKKESLRKKDFDRMMNGILLNQEQKEKEVKKSLKNFLEKQKKEACELKDALTKGEVERMKKAQIEIEKGITEIKVLLKNFCEQQEDLTEKLKKLLSKGNDLKIKDFKDMIRNLQTLKKRGGEKMGLQNVATDIKSLGHDMATSYVDRKKTIEALQNEVSEMLRNFNNLLKGFHEENAQRKEEVTQMLEDFDELMENFHKGNVDARKEVHQFLKRVHQFMKGVHSENAQRRAEVSDLLESSQEDMRGVHKENVQRRKEVNKLKEGFWKENEQRQDEVGALVSATKEMWSTVAKVKGGAKKVSAYSHAKTERKKPIRRVKGHAHPGKSKKVQSISTR